MKIKPGFELRDVCGEKVLTPQGLGNIDFNALIALNETSAYLYVKLLGRDFTAEDMADLLLEEYEVSREQALTDCKALAEKWIEIGLAE